MLSGTAEYALRAVVRLAQHAGRGPVRAEVLASVTGIPRNYLGKILHGLVRAGVLTSTRGKHGGFQLAVPPTELPLIRIVQVFDDLDGRRECLLGRPECSDRDPCPVHNRWKTIAEDIAEFFKQTTVADVLQDTAPRGP